MEEDNKLNTEKKVNNPWFGVLGPASLIYALVYAACIFRNTSGIMVPVWIAATIGYVRFVMKQFGKAWKKDSVVYMAAMLVFGISTVLTGNEYIIFLNYCAVLFLLVMMLVHNIFDDQKWSIGKNAGMFIMAICGAIINTAEPVVDGIEFFQNGGVRKNKKLMTVLLGLVLAIPVVLVLGVLLASADAVFANVMSGVADFFALENLDFGLILLIMFGFFSSYCGMKYLLNHPAGGEERSIKKREPMAAIAFLSVITAMYLLFSGIQVYYLFLGYGTLPADMTYAEYARTGFFQLLFVIAVNVFLILIMNRYIRVNAVLRSILLTICGCTYIMTASSCYRMLLYIGAYHLTFLRVFVLVALAVMAVVMAGVIASLFRDDFPLYRYCLITVMGIYLAFSLSHVDYFIARYNLEHMTESTKDVTLEYLGNLSTDAAPAINEYLESKPADKLEIISALERFREEDEELYNYLNSSTDWFLWYVERNEKVMQKKSIREWNLSHWRADQSLNWR